MTMNSELLQSSRRLQIRWSVDIPLMDGLFAAMDHIKFLLPWEPSGQTAHVAQSQDQQYTLEEDIKISSEECLNKEIGTSAQSKWTQKPYISHH